MLFPRPLFVALALIAAIWAAVILLWPDATIGLTFDDSFYYFEIAQRFASGQGSTFDGIHYTNGYHPLWMWLASAIFLGGWSGEGPVRALLMVQVVLALLGTAMGLLSLDWNRQTTAQVNFAAMLILGWLAVPMILRTEVSGMESAVAVVVHGLLLAWVCRQGVHRLHEGSVWARLGLGALLGVSILARSDAALLTPLLALWALPGAIRSGRKGLLSLAVIGVVPALSLGLFLAANWLWFQTPLQVSGTLKRVPPGVLGIAILIACALGIVAVAWVSRRGLGAGWPTLGRWLSQSGWYVAFILAITGYYTGLQTFARQWYFAPLVLWCTIALAALALDLAAKAISDKPQVSHTKALLPLGLILMLPFVGGAVYTTYQLSRPETLAVRKADRSAAEWLDQNLSPETRVGSWDAGLIGYHARVPIINLDGVVNDVQWLHAMQDGTAGERLHNEDVRWIANHSFFEDGACTSINKSLARLDPAGRFTLKLVKAWPYEQVGRINGVAGGRHKMATCVMQVIQPRTPEVP